MLLVNLLNSHFYLFKFANRFGSILYACLLLPWNQKHILGQRPLYLFAWKHALSTWCRRSLMWSCLHMQHMQTKKYVCLHFCPHWSDVKRSQLKSAVVQSKLQSKCLVKCSEFRSMHPSRRRLQVFQSQRFMPTQIWWRTIQLLEKLCYWDVPNWASYPSVSPYPDTGRTHSSYSDPSPPSRHQVWLQWWYQLSFQPEFLIIHC